MSKICIYLNGKKNLTRAKFSPIFYNDTASHFLAPQAEALYFVDGGVNFIPLLDLPSSKSCDYFFVGDKDSSLKKQFPFPVTEFSLPQNKNYSDFSFALSLILENKKEKGPLFLEVFAGLGGRKDHEFINILEAMHFIKELGSEGAVFFHPNILITNAKISLLFPKKRYFSLISLQENARCSINGALYSGEISLQRPSHGLSNRVLSKSVTLEAHHSVLALLC